MSPVKCPLCPGSVTITNLEQHKRTFHPDNVKTYKLKDKNEKPKPIRKVHRNTHEHKTVHSCHICPKVFKKKPYLNAHLKWHEEKASRTCDICSKVMKTKGSLRSHVKTHEQKVAHVKEEPSKCDICEKYFYNVITLNNHKLIAHPHLEEYVKPVEHKCSKCGKEFAREISLVTHMTMNHEEIKPYACEICGKKYRGKHGLNTHHKTAHEKLKPYKCDICEQLFAQEGEMERHAKRNHNIKIRKKRRKKGIWSGNSNLQIRREYNRQKLATKKALQATYEIEIKQEEDLDYSDQEQSCTTQIFKEEFEIKQEFVEPFECEMDTENSYPSSDLLQYQSSVSDISPESLEICTDMVYLIIKKITSEECEEIILKSHPAVNK